MNQSPFIKKTHLFQKKMSLQEIVIVLTKQRFEKALPVLFTAIIFLLKNKQKRYPSPE